MKLLIVESPTKAVKIAAMLGTEWRVEASRGHLRDLPEDALGVDLTHDFALAYQLLPDHRGTLTRLKKCAAQAETVYLATDPDREGEAIAWHLAELLKTNVDKSRLYRVTFNAITPAAVLAGIASPRRIDLALVDAQQTRRTLDRLVGYLVSPLACQKLDGRYSAGRVQSACLRLVVERERAIAAFKPVPYWTLDANLQADDVTFAARLSAIRDFRTTHWSQAVVEKLAEALLEAPFTVAQAQVVESARRPAPPFTTATLQQAASKALHLSPERTMQLAQTLYEHGLITYMRTDAVSIAPEAQQAARAFIAGEYGDAYVPTVPQVYTTYSVAAQEAHEAIRPTVVTQLADTLPDGEGRALYALIWQRFVASQMSDARYTVRAALIHAAKTSETQQPVQFVARGRTLVFDGFLKVYEEPLDEGETRAPDEGLPVLTKGQPLKFVALVTAEHIPEPPQRYTEAVLVAALERSDIGRPSTYAGMVRLIGDKGYVTVEKRRLIPTATGITLNDFLGESFPAIFEMGFTAQLERQLDQIAVGSAKRLDVLTRFWQTFEPAYRLLAESFTRTEQRTSPPPKVVGVCPKCGGDLIERQGEQGVFAGCVNFPKCKGRPTPVTFLPVQKGNA